MIDPHVHFRDWAQRNSETIKHGLSVAKMCGFTHVFDMPNTFPNPLTTREAVKARLQTAEESKVDGIEYHIYIGLTKDPLQILRAVNMYNEFFPKVIGLKLYAGPTTGALEVSSKDDQELVFKTLVERGYTGVVAVHCEKVSLFKENLYDKSAPHTHSLARPKEAEVESVKDILEIAEKTGFQGTVHFAHVSTFGSVRAIKNARGSLKVTFGITPHHSLLTIEDAKESGRFLKVNPPLREEIDRACMFEALMDGTADWIETDHAPHTIYDKEFKDAAGLPGFAGYLLLIKKLREADISPTRLEELIGKNAAKTFGIEITEKDLIVPRAHITISRSAQNEYKYRPYELGDQSDEDEILSSSVGAEIPKENSVKKQEEKPIIKSVTRPIVKPVIENVKEVDIVTGEKKFSKPAKPAKKAKDTKNDIKNEPAKKDSKKSTEKTKDSKVTTKRGKK